MVLILYNKGRTIRKIMGGGRGILEPQEFFFLLLNSLYEFFLGHSMNIFFHLIFPCANIFFVLRPPPPQKKSFLMVRP